MRPPSRAGIGKYRKIKPILAHRLACASSADEATALPFASFGTKRGAVSPASKARDPTPEAITSAVARYIVSMTVRGMV
jgi:hypothetical protein